MTKPDHTVPDDEIEKTEELLAQVGAFVGDYQDPRWLCGVIHLLCECMIEAGLGEDDSCHPQEKTP